MANDEKDAPIVVKKLKLQIKYGQVRKRIEITNDSTISVLKSMIEDLFKIESSKQSLLCGFPPKKLIVPKESLTLNDLKIRSGESFIIKKEGSSTTVKKGKLDYKYIPPINKTGAFTKRPMDPDNNCLFHSINYVCKDKTTGLDNSIKLRKLAAALIAADPKKYNTVFLGAPNYVYQQTIMNPNVWGGAIELSIFSDAFQCNIHALDMHYLREDIYIGTGNYKRRVFVLYNGKHYDALAYNPRGNAGGNSGDIVMFSLTDKDARRRCLSYVKSIHMSESKAGKCTEQKEWKSSEKKPEKPKSVGHRVGGSNNTPTKPTASSNEWACKACTFKNKASKSKCDICGGSK